MFGGVGVGVLGLAGVGVLTDVLPGGPRARRFLGLTGPVGKIPDVPAGPTATTRLASKARGALVNVVTMAPDGFTAEKLPKCVALHGYGGDANWMVSLGMPQFLTAAVRAGVQPFAVVSVDGGNNYWVEYNGDDPQRMLTEELGQLDAAMGISMGAFGALCFARRRPSLKAVAVASPSLFPNWADVQKRGTRFASEQRWEDEEPLRHTDLITETPLGVWCGTEDPTLEAAHSLIAQTHPARTAITSGAHEDAYWRRILPEMLAFVGERIA
ncbi:enterochelin esterase-like enzyme [Actinocrispum wychmicini]|uniref:Enterochelin esterase-like enzyme n=1 Tax=Actinocrispum wychmicini TaxID=1213861 RepID=A0A4R2JCX0_9PSEU|nr:enterochelin esterase-like enzyme [Actinocrispum wychmicini]